MGSKKIIIIIIILACVCFLYYFTCEEYNNSIENNDIKNEIVSNEEETIEKQVLAEDEIVNNFLINYNNNSEDPFIDISKGNIRTKYYASSYGYSCEILNVNDKIIVTINETNENANLGISGMKNVFVDIVKSIDSSLEKEDISTYFDDKISGKQIEKKIGNMECFFSPDVELSWGQSRGYIKIEEV